MRVICQVGVIRCTDQAVCKQEGLNADYLPTPLFDFIARHFPRRTVCVCSSNLVNYSGSSGETVIHEWAHGCGFDPDKGLPGIPGSEPQ